MADSSAAREADTETVQVCGVCGYVLADCVTHPGVHPLLLAPTVRKVARKSEEHTRALSEFHSNRSKWDRRMKDAAVH